MKTRIRRVRLRIRYKRRSDLVALVALTLLAPAFLGTLAWGQKDAAADAQAAPAAFTPMRKYYLTQGGYYGNTALTACASGYHMASLWELLDSSNLEYNSDLGAVRADSGAGPRAGSGAWIRTGWDSETGTGIPGRDNCAAWTSNDGGHGGTVAWLPNNWTGGHEDMHVWAVDTAACDDFRGVWCVEDYPSFTYLPLVLKD